MVNPDGGRFTYLWDAAGRIRRVTNPESQRTTWSYDAAGRQTTRRLSTQSTTTYTYDDADRLTQVKNAQQHDDDHSLFDYAYDAVGNRTRMVEQISGDRVTWTYDNLYQLTREHRTGGTPFAITYTYDPAGNRQTHLESGVRTTWTYDAANQLVTGKFNGNIRTYTYDAAGNERSRQADAGQITTFTWDCENQPSQVAQSATALTTYVYNGEGRRVQKRESSGTTNFLWDFEHILAEGDASYVTQVVYTLACPAAPQPRGTIRPVVTLCRPPANGLSPHRDGL